MARQNEREARWTVELLAIQPDARVLEIGFGPGVAIQYAAKRATRGHVSGIDYSETMLTIARTRDAAGIANGVVDLREGDVQSLPYADDSFDRAFSHSLRVLLARTGGVPTRNQTGVASRRRRGDHDPADQTMARPQAAS